MIKIEKGIPVCGGGERKNGYPFVRMEAGDSFVVPTAKIHSVRSLASRETRYNLGKRWVVRTHEGVTRCWRVK